MNKQAASPGCPDPETISAFFDGECDPGEAIRAHLGSCPECARRLADYAAMRGHLTRAVASEPDPGFDARIAAFVRAEAAKDAPAVARPNRNFSDSRAAWIFRIAALFILSGFFVYLLMDRMQPRRPDGGRASVAGTENVRAAAGRSVPAVLDAESGAGDFVKARLVSNTPSSRQYAIDIDPMLIPDEFSRIPAGDGVPVPIPLGQDGGAMHRIPLRGNPSADAMRMLESIRRDLTALDVPGLSVDAESRGSSLFTTIRLESAGKFDMSVRRTEDTFEFFLMSGDFSGDDGPVCFQIEFFCE